MKRLLSSMLVFVMLASITACSDQGEKQNESSDIPPTSSSEAVSESESEAPAIPDYVYSLSPLSEMCLIENYGAPSPGESSSHGGNQTRILTTSHGVYAAYIVEGSVEVGGMTHHKYALVKFDTDGCTVIHEGYFFINSNSPYIMADKDENIYVVCGSKKPQIWKYDHVSGEVTEYGDDWYRKYEGYGYTLGFIDNFTNNIYVVFCTGDKIGSFTIIRFDLDTCEFNGEYTFKLQEGRHCYLFGFADGKGGFFLVGQRDISLGATGFRKYFTGNDYWAQYVWDEIRIFAFETDENNDIVRAGTYEVDTAEYVQETKLFVQNTYYRDGDIFVDNAGNIHVFYLNICDNGIAEIVQRHKVYNSSYEVIYDEALHLDERFLSNEIKMHQSSDGTYYLVVMPKILPPEDGTVLTRYDDAEHINIKYDTMVQIYRSEDGFEFTEIYEKTFDGEKWAPYHISASQPRNGSTYNNKLELMISPYYGNRWYYLTVDFNAIETLYQYGLLN